MAALTNNKQGKPLLICVHGFLDNAASFEPMFPFLDDFHLIAIDQAGHGKSSHRKGHSVYQLSDYVLELYEFISFLAPKEHQRVSLIGHSLGAIVTSLFGACFSDKVERLFLIDALGPITSKETSTIEQMRSSILNRANYDEHGEQKARSLSELVAARCQLSKISPEHAELILRRNLLIEDSNNTLAPLKWRTDRALRNKSPLRLTDTQAEDVMRNINCPVSFFYAASNYELFKKRIEEYKKALADFEAYEFDTGHHLHMEVPEALCRQIRKRF